MFAHRSTDLYIISSFDEAIFIRKEKWGKRRRKETSILLQQEKKLVRSYLVSPAVYIITVKLHDDDGSNSSSGAGGLLFLLLSLSLSLIFCCCYCCYRRNSLEKNSQCICMLAREILQMMTTMLSSFGWATETILSSNLGLVSPLLSLSLSLLVIRDRVIFALSKASRNSRVSVSI